MTSHQLVAHCKSPVCAAKILVLAFALQVPDAHASQYSINSSTKMYFETHHFLAQEGRLNHLHRLMCTELRCWTPFTSVVSVYIGPTSQVKKAGVIFAFSSAPHLEYGKTFLNHLGTFGKPLITASLCSFADLPCAPPDATSCICCHAVSARQRMDRILCCGCIHAELVCSEAWATFMRALDTSSIPWYVSSPFSQSLELCQPARLPYALLHMLINCTSLQVSLYFTSSCSLTGGDACAFTTRLCALAT